MASSIQRTTSAVVPVAPTGLSKSGSSCRGVNTDENVASDTPVAVNQAAHRQRAEIRCPSGKSSKRNAVSPKNTGTLGHIPSQAAYASAGSGPRSVVLLISA